MVKFKFLDKFLKTNVNTNDKKLKPSNTESNLVPDLLNSNNILNSNLKLLNEHLVCNCCFEILKNPITVKILSFFIKQIERSLKKFEIL